MSNTRLAQKIAHNIDPSWPKPIKFFGGGVNGRVYKTNNGRLMKFIYDYAPQEYAALQKLQGTFVVPRFKKGNGHTININENLSQELRTNMFPNAYNNSDTLTVFLMGRVGNASSTTLRNYISKHPGANRKIIARRVAYLVKEMHLRGVSHGNLHDNNIIVSFDSAGRITGMWAIDFGRSQSIPLGKTETKMFKSMKPNLKYPTASLYGKTKQVPVYNGSRSNINMLRAVTTAKMASGMMKRIAKLRKEIVEEMKQYRSPTRRSVKSKSLSPRRSATRVSPARPRSAPARTSLTRVKTLRRSVSIKRKRA
jgi:Lipopolysaccharide kinase (Kdo/WaaP) family